MNDLLDAQWAQQENEQQLWEQHCRVSREFRDWSIKEGFMKTSQMVQSKFLKKEDFPQPEVLTIRDCSLEEVGRGDERWVIYFKEKTKGIVLNVTKIRQLEAAYGDDTDHWQGKKVKASNDPTVMMGQQVVGGIKFTMPSTAKPEPKPAPKQESSDFDDDIPF